MKHFTRELKFALASLQAVPGFVSTIVATLGITLGALVCIVALNLTLFVKPLPYQDHERLFKVDGTFLHNGNPIAFNNHSFKSARALHKMDDVFETASISRHEYQRIASLPSQPSITAAFTTPEFFDMTNATMHLGRAFGQTESIDSQNPVAVISYDTWQNHYNSDKDILGKKIEVNSKSYSIVGVTAADYVQPEIAPELFKDTEVWMPWEFHSALNADRDSWGALLTDISVLGKIKPELSGEQAKQLLSNAINKAFVEGVAPGGRKSIPYSMAVEMNLFEHLIVGESRSTALLLLGAAVTLLLIASSNAINLMLSRTVQKHRQLTIRATLGANKRHLFIAILAENSILMALVSIVSLLMAFWGFSLLQQMANGQLPRLAELSLGAMELLFTFVTAALLAAVFSALSISMVKYRQLQASIQSSGKGSGLQVSTQVRNMLVASQIALAGVLLVANISVLKSSTDTVYREMGFNKDNLITLLLAYEDESQTEAEQRQMRLDLLRDMALNQQVAGVAGSTSEPTGITEVGQVSLNSGDEEGHSILMSWISDNYFDVVERKLIKGRYFTANEVTNDAQVAIISETLAARLFENAEPIGQKFFRSNNPEPYTVVGIISDLTLPALASQDVGEVTIKNHLFMPGLITPFNPVLRFMVRLKDNQKLSDAEIQAMLDKVDPKLTIQVYETMEEVHMRLLARELTASKIAIALGLLSLLMAGVGIYGVLNYGTQLRRYELGVRMSLGASPAKIVKQVLSDNAKPVFWGFVVCVLLATFIYSMARQYIEQYVYVEALPILSTVALIVLTAAIASYLPVRTIVRQWPVHSLRN